MHIHVMRVQKTKSQRQWWIKGDTGDNDLMKFHPKITRKEAITIFELEYDCKVNGLYYYKGTHRPSEAAMTAADIMLKYQAEEEELCP